MTTTVRRIFALVAFSALVLLATAAVGRAQPEYPPGEADIACDVTEAAPGEPVFCSTPAQSFQPGSEVSATLTSQNAQAAAGAPTVAMIGSAILAQGSGEPFTLTQTVTAADDGSASATFEIPEDGERGPVTLTFEGTAPDGSPQTITETAVIQVAAAQAGQDLADTGSGTGLWFGIAAAVLVIGGGFLFASRRVDDSRDEETAGVG